MYQPWYNYCWSHCSMVLVLIRFSSMHDLQSPQHSTNAQNIPKLDRRMIDLIDFLTYLINVHECTCIICLSWDIKEQQCFRTPKQMNLWAPGHQRSETLGRNALFWSDLSNLPGPQWPWKYMEYHGILRQRGGGHQWPLKFGHLIRSDRSEMWTALATTPTTPMSIQASWNIIKHNGMLKRKREVREVKYIQIWSDYVLKYCACI